MKITIETITPEMAKNYLEMNTDNYRAVSQQRVAMYAEDMANGKWQFNGEAIKFSKSGVLKDGQTRLHAIVKANVPVQMLVIYGVEDDINIYDVNQNRSAAQIAKTLGFGKNANITTLGAAAMMASPTWNTCGGTAKGVVVDYYAAHSDEFSEAMRIARFGKSNAAICRKAPIVAFVYCLIRLGRCTDSVNEFFSIVNTGFPVDGKECSAAITLRNALLSMAYKSTSRDRGKMLFAVTLQAFRDYDTGVARRKVYKPDFDLADRFRNKVICLDKGNIIELYKEA